MKFSAILAAAVLAFVASAAPLERAARRATTADLANVNASVGFVGAPAFVPRSPEPVVSELHKRQDNAGLKTLVINYLNQQKAPQIIIDLIKTAPAAIVERIMKLPPQQIQAVVDQLKSGRIPTIPGVTPKDLVISFLTPLGIPANTMGLISNAQPEVFEKITNLPLAQLEAVISSLKAGRIPNIPGVTDGVPGVDPAATGPVATAPVAVAPVAVAPVAVAPVANVPVTQPVAPAQTLGRKVKREFGRADAPLMVRQVQQLPPTGQVPTTGQLPPTTGQLPPTGQVPTGQMPPGQMPPGQMPPLPATGAELKAQTIADMTQGQAPANLIQHVQSVPDSVFDSLRALELQVGGQNGQPFNQAIAAQLDQYWGQLFNGQVPTIASTGTAPTAPVASAPVARVGTVPVGTAPVGTAPVGTAPVGTAPVGTVPVGTTLVGTIPGTTV